MQIQANWDEIRYKVQQAEWGQTGAIVQMYADRFGCSPSTIRRNLRRRFGTKRSVNRKQQVDPENRLIEKIFDLKLMGELMHLTRREVSTEWCIEELIRQGYEEARQLTVSTVNRRLAKMGYREKQPNMRIESAYANQVHMIDFSRSKYFQLFDRDERKDDYMLVVSGKELHYKTDDSRLRTWIVQYMDDYSRLRKVKAYPETNESAFLGLDHLRWCWMPDEQDHLLQYLPIEMLRSDNGAFRKAQETQTAMQAMGITMPAQMPGRKGGTAKVENRFRSLWQQFELPLAIRLGDGARIWLSEFNELLYEFCVSEQEKPHPVERDVTKGDWYRQSLADRSIKQRTTDVDIIRLACRVEKRRVDDHLRVSLNNTWYSVPQYLDGIPTTGKQIYVHINKYGELTGKLIDDLAIASFELTPWEASQWGRFESFKRTPKRLREDEFERDGASYEEIMGGTRTPGEDSSDAGKSVHYLGPDTEKVRPDSPFSERVEATGRLFGSEPDAREYVGMRVEALGLEFADVDTYFEGLMDSMPVSQTELDGVIEQIHTDFDNGRLASNY